MIDYHIHTRLCNHADGQMDTYVNRAVDLGLKEICFLDHLTLCEQGKALSMNTKEVPFYLKAVRDLNQKYKGVIDVKAGLEVDFDPEHVDIIKDITNTFSFDVIGSSVHFIDGRNIVSGRSLHSNGNKSSFEHLCGLYFEKLEMMLEHNYFDVICHFDVIKKHYHDRPNVFNIGFDKKIDEILSKIRYKNFAVEINTSGYDHPVKDIYPSYELIQRCCKKGINITLGSDAHNPKSVGQHFDRTTHLLFSAGYRYLSAYTRRMRYDVLLDNKAGDY